MRYTHRHKLSGQLLAIKKPGKYVTVCYVEPKESRIVGLKEIDTAVVATEHIERLKKSIVK